MKRLLTIFIILMFFISGCSGSSSKSSSSKTINEVVKGHNGDVEVSITFNNEKIEKIEVTKHAETVGIGDKAIEKVPQAIIDSQSVEVDTVSGATVTSNAIINAVKLAIKDAVLKEEDYLKGGSGPKEKTKETINTDVVVVGSGLSGITTGISAAENGASVVIVEKAGSYMFSFLTSRGNLMNAMVKENEASHIIESNDTLDAALKRWEEFSNIQGYKGIKYPDMDRVKTVLIESANSIKWLEDRGVDFEPSFTYEQRGEDVAKVVKQGDEPEGLTVSKQLSKIYEEAGGKGLLNTMATSLIVKDNVVVGVVAESEDTVYEIYAKAVVLATGGFGGSEEYLKEKLPEVVSVGYQFSGNTLNTGDGMKMAVDIGAQVYDNNWIIPSPHLLLPSKAITDGNPDLKQINAITKLEGANYQAKLLVDKNGKRLANEAAGGIVLAPILIDANLAPYYVLFDGSSKELVNLLEKSVDQKEIIKANTIEELSKLAGMDVLATSFDEYTKAVDSKTDSTFKKAEDFLVPYAKEGPYYLVHMVPDFVATLGGLVTNEEQAVLNEKGEAIQGLYAVGELAHRFMYNRAHLANASNSAAVSMGRLLGEKLAKEVKE